MMKIIPRFFIIAIFFFNVLPLFAQTSGKLSGFVSGEDKSPLVGANVILVDQLIGASTDLDGNYVILNIRPGVYTVRFEFIGYQTRVVNQVRISSDKTTRIDAVLKEEVLKQTEEVVVSAKKPLVEFNETSSISTMSSQDIDRLPVQSLKDLVNLQAGVVDGHFRGGRLGEVQYQVDGVSVNNPYDNSSSLQLDRSVIEEVQVISGTFDAKYGQAMSGVVNTVLKSGSPKLEWSGEMYGGDYYTSDKTRYPNNQDFSPVGLHSVQLTLSGPAFFKNTTFFMSGRSYGNDGYLFGRRRFLPTDSSDFRTPVIRPSGDNKLVAMNNQNEYSGQFKITNSSLGNIRLSYQAIGNFSKRHSYNHAFRFNPDGIKQQTSQSFVQGIDFTHTLSERMYYKLSLRQNYFSYTDFKYENLYDPRYLEAGSPKGSANYEEGAVIQGVDLGRFRQETNALVAKFSFTWQYNKVHLFETGFEAQTSKVLFGSPGYIRETNVNGVQQLLPLEKVDKEPGLQTYNPYQGAFYLQDRMEWDDLVLRAGMRLDVFNAQSSIPSDLQNPANSISGAPPSNPKKTSTKLKLSPRLGLSYPLSSTASLYFSYGHFTQIPGLALLYNNADYSLLNDLQAGGISYGVMGNPNLEPEVTVQYEFGLKQALTPLLGYELTVFYKDIRNLLGVEFVTTYAAADYARFTNVDFGSVYGFTLSLDQRKIGLISSSLDYTLQVARGNSSDVRETANRAAAGKDSRPRDIAFNWDQLHTLNAVVILDQPGNYNISTILKLGSGQPYTPQVGSGFGADLETNSGRKTGFVIVDLRAEKFFKFNDLNFSVYLRTFNLFNEYFVNGFVFSTTGSPDYSQFPQLDRATLSDPGRFYNPRRIEIGISFRGL